MYLRSSEEFDNEIFYTPEFSNSQRPMHIKLMTSLSLFPGTALFSLVSILRKAQPYRQYQVR